MNLSLMADPSYWLSLITLTFLELILGIDNLLFVAIAIGKLQGKEQARARDVGVWGAMGLRILMLAGIFWIIRLDASPIIRLPPEWSVVLGKGADAVARADFVDLSV